MGSQVKKGAVSIFAVIFAALLLTILTVGFIKIMIDDQRQATNNDLSQSAYDASLAGVEDAKRVVQSCLRDNTPAACAALANPDDCQTIPKARGLGGNNEETVVRSTQGDDAAGERFDQAYTCVKINMFTDDYLFAVQGGESEMVPLKASDDFDTVVVEWLLQDDMGVGTTLVRPSGDPDSLPRQNSWGTNAPPIIRAQLIRPGGEFNVDYLNDKSASQTAFLRPIDVVSGPRDNPVDLNPDIRTRPANSETLDNRLDSVICSRNFANTGYACKATVKLGGAIPKADSRNAFLRLNSVYKSDQVSVKVRLFNGDSLVQFDGVQPLVDSTGRAGSLYRRVEARLQLSDDFKYPNYAVDVQGPLCKNYSVDGTKAFGGDSCTP